MKYPVSLLSLLLLQGISFASDAWPGFRNLGDGISPSRKLPLEWSKDTVAWKVDLPGYGQSCPVIWKDKVFVTAVEGEQREKGFVTALDATTGKQLWSREFEPTLKAKWSYFISRAAPTPVVDESAVYAFFEGGNLLAFSHEGKELWSRSLAKEYGDFQNNHGLGSSLAQTPEAVIVLADHKGPSYLLAVDKKTGKNVWKVERESRSSWTSPVVVRRGERTEIVVSSSGSVTGYDAGSGKLLWERSGIEGNSLPSVAVAGDLLVVGVAKGRGKGGKPADGQELLPSCCLRLGKSGEKESCEVLWKAPRANASYASPLIYRDHVYLVNEVGVVTCVELKTGKECYSERIGGPCWASPVGAGDAVYFFGKDGKTTVLKPGPAFETLAVNLLWDAPANKPEPKAEPKSKEEGKQAERSGPGEYADPILYGVAANDRAFFVRTGKNLYRIGK
jgi:outer membrane protein assembly factor BamB